MTVSTTDTLVHQPLTFAGVTTNTDVPDVTFATLAQITEWSIGTATAAQYMNQMPSSSRYRQATPLQGMTVTWDQDKGALVVSDSTKHDLGVAFLRLEVERHQAQVSWTLRISGHTSSVKVASASDLDGLAPLVESLQDPETLMHMAALTAPAQVREITALTSLRAARANRSIPAVTTAKVRTAILRAGLGMDQSGPVAPGRSKAEAGGRLASINIHIAGKPVTVAVAVGAPTALLSRPLTAEETPLPGSWSTPEQRRIYEQLNSEAQEAWTARLVTALTAAGWRQVDGGSRSHWGKVTAWTLVDEDMWSGIAELATRKLSYVSFRSNTV
jgi:hypothetical protein